MQTASTMTVADMAAGVPAAAPDGVPHLTINHDVAADLDSSNAFEGPEKLLEVWFAPGAKALPPGAKDNGLKAVDASVWKGMLLSESSMFVFPHKIILKTCGTTTLLLGLHRLLRIAATEAGFPCHNATSPEELHAAATPHRVFYSRKNFLFPEKQRGPHRSWKQEVKFLDDMFEGGSAYLVGKMNGDHWYLYITTPNNTLTPPRTPESSKTGSPTGMRKIPTGIVSFGPGAECGDDETLEILMTDLDPEHARQFYLSDATAVASERASAHAQDTRVEHDDSRDVAGHVSAVLDHSTADCARVAMQGEIAAESVTTEGHALGTAVSDNCGLSDVYPTSVYPDARIDAYLFSPCGFSANGVIPAAPTVDDGGNKAAHYFTVHVTPEPDCSFASFETNVPGGQKGRQTTDIIEHVVAIFRPGRFSVTLFEAKAAKNSLDEVMDDDSRRRSWGDVPGKQRVECIQGYRRIDRVVHEFDDYDLVFRYYEREGWVGDGVARLGEDL